jgi:hypothetical protein
MPIKIVGVDEIVPNSETICKGQIGKSDKQINSNCIETLNEYWRERGYVANAREVRVTQSYDASFYSIKSDIKMRVPTMQEVRLWRHMRWKDRK